MRTDGDTSMSTSLAVRMYICSLPALLIGESSRVSRHCGRSWLVGQLEMAPSDTRRAGAATYLVCDVGPGIADVPVHHAHDADMLIAI